MPESFSDEHWMRKALTLAAEADACDEVPVGALVVFDNAVIGEGFNRPISCSDPTAHAEIIALREAAQQRQNYRLPGADLFVTIEPCTMCLGAIMHARVRRVVFGAPEPKAGVLVSQQMLASQAYFNHYLEVVGGVLEEECSAMISQFFQRRRKEKKKARNSDT